MDFGKLLIIATSAILINNFVLMRFLGLCPYIGVSKRLDSALGMGMGDGDGDGQGDGTGQGFGTGQGGTGGEGQGRGGEPLENKTATGFEDKKTATKLGKGKILHQLFVSGTPEKGEALVEYTDVARAAKQQAASSLAREKIPREYENIVKDYFDSLEIKKKED